MRPSFSLPSGVTIQMANIIFGSDGMTRPLGSGRTFGLSSDALGCSSQLRCPALVVEAGGAIRLCSDKNAC